MNLLTGFQIEQNKDMDLPIHIATLLPGSSGLSYAQDRTEDYSEEHLEHSETYRTRKKAGDVAEIPSFMPVITNRKYQYAVVPQENKEAYIQEFSEPVSYRNGTIWIKGLPASGAQLKSMCKNDGLDTIDLSLLRMFYGIILKDFENKLCDGRALERVVSVYYPDLARQMGKASNISRKDVEECIRKIMRFHTIYGITEKGKNILPVLLYEGEDRDRNIIRFSSPYINYVVEKVYGDSIKENKSRKSGLSQNRDPRPKPSYSYLVSSTIAKERNKRAVEIVCVVVAMIEQCGNGLPNISARTIIERTPQLREALARAKTTRDKNKLLDRCFQAAWRMLRTQTRLEEVYKEIILPDPEEVEFRKKYIPTTTTLDMVFRFPHKGKCGNRTGET